MSKINSKLQKQVLNWLLAAKKGAGVLSQFSTEDKNQALVAMAKALRHHKDFLQKENRKDLVAAKKHRYARALIDRLTLSDKMLEEMAVSLEATAKLKDPVGEILNTVTRPNGLVIKKVRVPIGVVAIIYESRPNVTSDCLAMCLKSGNAAVLKGGKEAFNSNRAIFKVLKSALVKINSALGDSCQLIDSIDRQAVEILLKQDQLVDLVIPRGGEELIRFVAENSLIPVIKHYKGICHIYVSEHADLNMAHAICFNAKVQKPGVCNAMETLLVNREAAIRFLPGMINDFKKAGVEIRGCDVTRKIVKQGVKPATEADWKTEYLDLILSVRVVDSLEAALTHIKTYGSQHSDGIITDDKSEGEQFLKMVDSACVYVNASTRFTDGYQFGMGAEIGISTDKIHARGPMGLEELTTYKYLVYGNGQIRQ